MLLTIENNNMKVVLSTVGGAIESILNKKTGNEHGWACDKNIWESYTVICFPICGGLTDDEYIYNEKKYPMPMHGFLRTKDLTLLSHSPTKAEFEFVFDQKTLKIYPFEFRFILTEELTDEGFKITYSTTNIGSEIMYFSVGSHIPYATPIVAGETMQEDYAILFDGSQSAGRIVVENEHVIRKTQDIFNGSDRLNVKNMFDIASTILDTNDINPSKISILSKKSGAKTTVMFEGFKYCVIWAPAGENPFVCIEPWTGMVDELNHDKDITKKLGITCLQPGQTHQVFQTISVE